MSHGSPRNAPKNAQQAGPSEPASRRVRLAALLTRTKLPASNASGTPSKPTGDGSAKPARGSREFTRRARAQRGKEIRRQTARRARVAPPRETLRLWLSRIPTSVRVCALLAFLNAVSWSLITPPFQAPDEQAHFAYVQQLAENNSLPREHGENFSPEERNALSALRWQEIQLGPTTHTVASLEEQRTLQQRISQPLARKGPGQAGSASGQPPLYYALATIPYTFGTNGTILARLQLVRLLSALMAALTAAFVFLFLREALPATPWAWTVGGLGVALAPLLGFMSGVVNPDAMLFAVSAALFYCLARAFRRGLTRRLALASGAVVAIGFATKLNFLGLAPGAMLGLVLLARREARDRGREAYIQLLAPSLLVALSPAILYALVNLFSGHPALGAASGTLTSILQGKVSLSRELSFAWQLYLPRLPGMHNYFGELLTTRQLWFDGLVGLYGWVDTVFPNWVYTLALIPAGAIALLCLRELVSVRAALRGRAGELLTYAVIALGLLLVVAVGGYSTATAAPMAFAEPRYLLPLLALWGAVLALAARGAGRRWGPVVGVALIVLIFAHDLFSQLQVISRYYG